MALAGTTIRIHYRYALYWLNNGTGWNDHHDTLPVCTLLTQQWHWLERPSGYITGLHSIDSTMTLAVPVCTLLTQQWHWLERPSRYITGMHSIDSTMTLAVPVGTLLSQQRQWHWLERPSGYITGMHSIDSTTTMTLAGAYWGLNHGPNSRCCSYVVRWLMSVCTSELMDHLRHLLLVVQSISVEFVIIINRFDIFSLWEGLCRYLNKYVC